MSEIPSHKKRFLESKWVAEIVSSVPPMITACYGAYAAIQNPLTRSTAWILFGSAAWLGFGALWKIRLAKLEEERLSPKGPLYAAIFVTQNLIAKQLKLPPSENDVLRITIHRVVKPKNPKELEQATPYVGGAGGDVGRKFSVQAGVIGRAARTGKPTILHFGSAASNADRIAELCEWGYTEDDAQAMVGKDRLSFMAVPIFGTQKRPICVVYLDSSREGLFSGTAVELVMDACSSVGSYISEQYR